MITVEHRTIVREVKDTRFGLKGLCERAELLGGKLDVDSVNERLHGSGMSVQ